VKSYLAGQGMFGIPRAGQCDYSQVIELDLGSVRGSVSGPRRPQERIDLPDLGRRFAELLAAPPPAGFGKAVEEGRKRWRRRTGTVSGLVRGGGEQDAASLPDGRRGNTSTLTEVEMMNNRPTPNEVEAASFGPTEDDVDLGHGDGRQLSIEFSIQLAKDAGGQIEWVIAVFRDVTERFAREKALRAQLKALEAKAGG
jgi:aconitate hydratase